MTAGDGIRNWTTPGRPPLVPEVTLLLAEDIHRTWSAIDEEAPPFWAFAWVGGQALARHVLDHPDLVRGRRVLDLASGSGLVAIAALRAGASGAVASDTDARARAAIVLNAQANDVEIDVVGDVLDADEPLDVDVVLAGDVFYEQPMARLVERFCDEAVAAGVDVVVGDPGREYLPRRRVSALGSYDVVGTLDLEGGETTRTTVYRFT
ncbi:class I SAM-dependent methyltransferase [Actinomycetospora callitridis]|uniref:class I SAM-dependent methyltransferase n=1 Tax=Actinomycetospora callitridis TaxID=913944 RepID=UPI002366FD5B|nr:50S ribosomal protein L11 methyltransferase [Actinomycetospora callitridis]MDD7920677.1 50S ribosomal protein L11 methyltransferase [Actinomycetospora callitridis]